MEEAIWIPIIGIICSMGASVLIVYFVARARQRRVEVQAEMQTRLIERFSNAQEMVTFLQSPAGKEFVTGVSVASGHLARERVLGGFTRAIVLTFLGLAFMVLAFWFRDDGWMIPAAIVLALGIGFLLATFVSYRLTAKMSNTDHA